jgi:multimeric flavodoxin WrbA
VTDEIKATILVCTLSPSPAESSSDKMAKDIGNHLAEYGVKSNYIRLADYNIKPGVEADMGEGDEWPAIRQHIVDSDILIVSTPTWVGHMSSFAQRALERLDAEISIEDDEGRPGMFGKVAGVAVVGNEDGAHKISGDLFQALNDIGFSLPAHAATYWNDEAMGSRNYKDLEVAPAAVAATTATLAKNLHHLATQLKHHQYPA